MSSPRLVLIAIVFAACVSQAFSTPIVYSFAGRTGIPGLPYDEFELRFKGDTDDVGEGTIENLLGTIHLPDGKVGTLDEPMTISRSEDVSTYSTVGFNPTGPNTTVSAAYDYQKDIRLLLSSSGENVLDISTHYGIINPSDYTDSTRRTSGYNFARDFSLTGLVNIRPRPADFAGQQQTFDLEAMSVETSLGVIPWVGGEVTFASTLVPEPNSFHVLGTMFLIGCAFRRRRNSVVLGG